MAALLLLATASCSFFSETDAPGLEGPLPGTEVALETVASGLVVPWALAFAPDGRIFVTERPGRIRVIDAEGLRPAPWAELDVAATGEAGLMGIALAPDFDASGRVYVAGTFRDLERNRIVNRVLVVTERGGKGDLEEVLVDGIPAAPFHAGAAVAFGPDEMLYVATGDARRPELSGDPRSLAGKILRYRPDGSVPGDNPTEGSPVYAMGLRNVQGLAWHPATGDLFATDHGPSGFPNERFRRGDDELNVVLPGGHHGWPHVAGRGGGDRFVGPLAMWNPAIAPNGLAIYTGQEFEWEGDAFVGALRGEELRRIELARAPEEARGWRVAREVVLFDEEVGRIRAVAMGPDGRLYFTTSNRDGRGSPGPEDDRVLRIVQGRERRPSASRVLPGGTTAP